MNKGFIVRLMLFVCSLVFSGWSMADESEASVQVSARSWIGKRESKEVPVFAPTQQIILYVEVATNTWYTSGTQIASLEIPDVLVKQRNPFAINSSVRKQGQTWSTQLWEIVLYPQKSGEFVVPPVNVNVEVATQGSDKKQVTLQTKPVSFRIELPNAELDNSRRWFSSSKATVKQDWQTSSDELKVGDSVTRIVDIQAQDSLSVLLPNMMTSSENEAWQAYVNSPELTDTQSRDGYISKRKDSVTYILQQGGDISWPSFDMYWWNTEKQSVEKITIDGYSVHVKHTLSSWLRAYRVELISSLSAVVLLLGSYFLLRRYFRTHAKPAWYEFSRALLQRRWADARTLLYKKARLHTQSVALTPIQKESKWNEFANSVQRGNAQRTRFIWLWRHLANKTKVSFKLSKALKELDKN